MDPPDKAFNVGVFDHEACAREDDEDDLVRAAQEGPVVIRSDRRPQHR
jgi:hypothetical protein